MSIEIDQLIGLTHLRRGAGLSERELARKAGLSRMTLRNLESGIRDSRLSSLAAVAAGLGRRVELVFSSEDSLSAASTVGVTFRTCGDGEGSWKTHFMDLVDEFRRTRDGRLIALPPPAGILSARLQALLASIVFQLTRECGMDTPGWAKRVHFLPQPWFVSESEALKASALLESPLVFRRNNIFVLASFLERV